MQTHDIMSDMDKVVYNVPIAKVDQARRIVSGFATLNNLDKQGDVVTTEASIKAFKSFRGNIRELHDKIAAGRLLSFGVEKYYDKIAQKVYDGVFVRAYISKGAPNTWEKVLDGTLNGFSIGGEILDSEDIIDENGNIVHVIKDYVLHELSLVDNPANPFANIVAIEKAHAHFNDIAETIDEKELKDMTTDLNKSVDTVEAVEADTEVVEAVVEDTAVVTEPVVEAVAEESAAVVEDPAEVVDEPQEVAVTSPDVSVLTEALNEIKGLLEAKASKDSETDQAFSQIIEQLKELRTGVETNANELAAVKSTVNEFDKRVESVEADTAVRKSGDLGEVAQVEKTQKSLWGGRFLSTADL